MHPSETTGSDLILDIDPEIDRAIGPRLIDAPRIEDETTPSQFNWRPTLLIVFAVALLMAAIAFL